MHRVQRLTPTQIRQIIIVIVGAVCVFALLSLTPSPVEQAPSGSSFILPSPACFKLPHDRADIDISEAYVAITVTGRAAGFTDNPQRKRDLINSALLGVDKKRVRIFIVADKSIENETAATILGFPIDQIKIKVDNVPFSRCTKPFMPNFWNQFAKVAAAWQMVLEYEKQMSHPFDYLIRMRTDNLGLAKVAPLAGVIGDGVYMRMRCRRTCTCWNSECKNPGYNDDFALVEAEEQWSLMHFGKSNNHLCSPQTLAWDDQFAMMRRTIAPQYYTIVDTQCDGSDELVNTVLKRFCSDPMNECMFTAALVARGVKMASISVVDELG